MASIALWESTSAAVPGIGLWRARARQCQVGLWESASEAVPGIGLWKSTSEAVPGWVVGEREQGSGAAYTSCL